MARTLVFKPQSHLGAYTAQVSTTHLAIVGRLTGDVRM